MDLIGTARRLESKIARTLDEAAERALGRPARDPLAIIHAAVEAIERELQPAGRGRRVLPYNSIGITFVAASAAERARYEAIIDCGPDLHSRIVQRLRAAGAEVSQLEVRTAFAREADAHWTAADFNLELSRAVLPVEVPLTRAAAQSPIQLTVLHGQAAEPHYSMAAGRIDLGRGLQVRNARGQLTRTNHVAFVEGGGEPNASVSRRHAHIAWDASSREYRIHDDGSTHGTQVLRHGTMLVVRTGARGTRLRDGDEIVLGEARLRVGLGGN